MLIKLVKLNLKFYFWQIEPALKHCEIKIHCDHDCLKIWFLFSKVMIMFEVSGESTYFTFKSCLYQCITDKQRWKVSTVKFSAKPNIILSAYTKILFWNFNTTDSFKILEKKFEGIGNCKSLMFGGKWAKLRPDVYLLRQSGTKFCWN